MLIGDPAAAQPLAELLGMALVPLTGAFLSTTSRLALLLADLPCKN